MSGAWDGRPPAEHVGAPAHLLQFIDRPVAAIWSETADIWVIGDIDYDPEYFCNHRWSYVAPLYPAAPPAAPSDEVARLRSERALRVLSYLESVTPDDEEPMYASEWLECADGLSRPEPTEPGERLDWVKPHPAKPADPDQDTALGSPIA